MDSGCSVGDPSSRSSSIRGDEVGARGVLDDAALVVIDSGLSPRHAGGVPERRGECERAGPRCSRGGLRDLTLRIPPPAALPDPLPGGCATS